VDFGLSVLPAALFWEWHFRWSLPANWIRIVLLSMSLVPAYVLFVFSLMVLSALSVRLLGWRTPANAEMRIADLGWPVLRWARYAMSTHVVRVFAGTLVRATPLWTFYHRLNGARLGRRVYLNSVTLSDHNLLEFDDDVVIGAGVHLSGHVVERGVVKTAPVRLGRNVMIGVGSVIGIGVEIGANTQVGALSFVPKHRMLQGDAVYGGVPVRRLDLPDSAT
jgi:acetyltransferase-like isoleucine patch superfamily enzyme